jgi:hypothetical protein
VSLTKTSRKKIWQASLLAIVTGIPLWLGIQVAPPEAEPGDLVSKLAGLRNVAEPPAGSAAHSPDARRDVVRPGTTKAGLRNSFLDSSIAATASVHTPISGKGGVATTCFGNPQSSGRWAALGRAPPARNSINS